MKIALVATYPPQQCGIGTFTHSLANAMKSSADEENEIIIIAMNDNHEKYEYPPEVKFSISQEQQTDYLAAADFINRSGAEVCILEHEFGIYGGQRRSIYFTPFISTTYSFDFHLAHHP